MTDPAAQRKRTVAVFDLDGTVTTGDTYVAFLVRFLLRHPARVLRACWLPIAVGLHWIGARDNTWLKVTFLRAVAGGASRAAVNAVATDLVARLQQTALRSEAAATIAEHRRRGHRLVLATASLDVYAERLGLALGFDEVVCTRVAWDDRGRLTGALDGDNCYGERKRAAVAEILGHRPDVWLVAYSDHESDLPLLAWSDRAAVVNPKYGLRAQADKNGFEVLSW